MPKLKAVCADCGKPITSDDFGTGMVIYSAHTRKRWCPKCVFKLVSKKPG